MDHTKPSAGYRGKELIIGAERFLTETEQLAKREDVLSISREFDKKRKGE